MSIYARRVAVKVLVTVPPSETHDDDVESMKTRTTPSYVRERASPICDCAVGKREGAPRFALST
eukprot:658533-Prorocentrum_minimum.AAC.1